MACLGNRSLMTLNWSREIPPVDIFGYISSLPSLSLHQRQSRMLLIIYWDVVLTFEMCLQFKYLFYCMCCCELDNSFLLVILNGHAFQKKLRF